MKLSPLFALSTLVASTVATGISSAPASAALFTEAQVNQDNFVVVASPRANNQFGLVVIEQRSDQRACWQDNGNGTIDPLLLNFDFSGICGRATDGNGYSIRVAGEDLALQYSLRLVDRGDHVALVGTPSNRRQQPLEIGRTQVVGSDFLEIDLNPGWELSRRVFDGRPLGHLYFTNATSLADTIAQQPAPQPISRPISRPVADPVEPIAQIPEPTPIAGTPLPTPPSIQQPIAEAPIEEEPVVIEVVPVEDVVVDNGTTETPVIIAAEPEGVNFSAEPPSFSAQFAHFEVLNSLYQEVFDRNIDIIGLNYYNRRLEQGSSVAWVRDRLINSLEYRRLSALEPGEMEQGEHFAALNAVYNEVLGRNVDASGFVTYSNSLSSGRTLDEIRDRLVRSDEGRAVAIDRAYLEVLGRHVDPSGLSTYLRRVKRSGWTIARVHQDLANSNEAAANIAQR